MPEDPTVVTPVLARSFAICRAARAASASSVTIARAAGQLHCFLPVVFLLRYMASMITP